MSLWHDGSELWRTAAIVPAGFQDTQVASGIAGPTALGAAPDGRLFILEQAGRITIVKNGTLLPTPFADLRTFLAPPTYLDTFRPRRS